MAIVGYAELLRVADGTTVEIEGRYQSFRPFPPPPGPPRNAQVALAGGVVLIGRYLDPESERPAEELARLEGARVRVAGRFFRTRAWPEGQAMPGIWTGGGPQLVEVEPPVLLAAAPPISPSPPPSAPTPPPAPADPPEAPTEAPPPEPRFSGQVGPLARRSLAFGASRLLGPALVVAALAAGAAAWPLGLALGLREDPLLFLPPIVAAGLTLVVIERVLVRWLSARELDRLAASRWPFDLGAYVALLDTEHGDRWLRVEIELERPGREGFTARPLRRVELVWISDRLLRVTGPWVASREGAHPRLGPGRPTNAGLHRWTRKIAGAIIEPLDARAGVRRVELS